MNDTPAISLPGPTNCRLCSEVSLRNNVHSLGLSFDSNHLDSSAVSDSESLILVLRSSITFDSNHAVRLITSLQSSSNLDGLSPDHIQWYKTLTMNEYGLHGKWCIEGIMPTVASLALLAIFLDINIFVITNDYVLNAFHNGSNIIKFPNRTGVNKNVVISI